MAWNDGRALTTDELLVANNWLHNEAKGDTDLLAKKATEYGMNNAQRQQLARDNRVEADRIDAWTYSTRYMRATELENGSAALNERLHVTSIHVTGRINVSDMGA